MVVRALIALLLAGSVADQRPEPIRINVQLVEINVVALDKTGEPVVDLTKNDFEILDNGKPQEVRFFALETKSQPSVPPVPPPEHVFSNKTLGKVAIAPGVSVVLFDLLNTEFADQANSKQQLLSLMHKLPTGERIGVYVLGREVSVLHDFTDDPRQLAAVLAHFEGRPASDLVAIEDTQARPMDLGAAANRFA